MPVYIYQHPETKETKEVFQEMNAKHVYFEDGVEWNRVFTPFRISIDNKLDPFSESDFMKKTENKKGTIGDWQDISKELSEKREKIAGVDPVKENLFSDYEKKTGKKHVVKVKEEAKKELDKLGFEYE